MKATQIVCLIVLIVLGGGMFLYGGHDDSPGAQLLGVVAVIAGIGGIFMLSRKE